MPYSLNSDANKENPSSPSLNISLNEQFIYRLASLESTLREGFKHLDEKFESLNRDTTQRRQELARNFELFKAEVHTDKGAMDVRLSVVEKWQNAMTVRFSLAAGTFAVLYTILGEPIRQALGLH